MAIKDVDQFFEELQEIFAIHFGEFSLNDPGKLFDRYAYYRNYDAQKLSILVTLPIASVDHKKIYTKEKIGIALKDIGSLKRPYRIELEDTRLSYGWQHRLRDRIEILQDLMDVLMECNTCGQWLLPRVCRRKDASRTKFVALYCAQFPYCRAYKTTPFGTTLKTRLHSNLKKMSK